MKINPFDYCGDQKPPQPSPRLAQWVAKIEAGWQPNRRVRHMGYSESAGFFGVYVWEYLNVILPMLYPDVYEEIQLAMEGVASCGG